MKTAPLILSAAFCAATVLGAPLKAAVMFPLQVDFSVEDDGVTPLVNGQAIDDEFGVLFDINSDADTKDHLGPAIFDTTPGGPNASGSDSDLLVDLGNALILQNSDLGTQTVAGFFDIPNDESQDSDLGHIEFAFIDPVELLAIDLIDINGGVTVDLMLTDENGLTREYDVPSKWTFDISAGGLPPTAQGYDTLLLTTLDPQDGEGTGGDAIASEDAGFDSTQVVSLTIEFGGSAAIDNLVIGGVTPNSDIPEPAAATLLLAMAATLGLAKRR